VTILEAISASVNVPNETHSECERDRFHHFDLRDRTEIDLRRELAFTRWLNHITDSPWHQDREDAIGQELRHRHDVERTRRAS
jgi:hypothetical protein